MICEEGTPIGSSDWNNILVYLKFASRSNSGLTVKLQIEPDAILGKREIRVVGNHGGSAAFQFEVDYRTNTILVTSNPATKLLIAERLIFFSAGRQKHEIG